MQGQREKYLWQTDGVRTWVMQGEHDTQSGKVLKEMYFCSPLLDPY